MAKIVTLNGQISSSAPIDFKIGASSSFYIGNGSIGIGTTTPDSALDIESGYITLPELVYEPETVNITPGKGALYLSGSDSKIYFKNDLGDVYDLTKSGSANAGTITGVTAGTNLTGGGTNGSVTLSLSSSVTNLTRLQASQVTASNITIIGTASLSQIVNEAYIRFNSSSNKVEIFPGLFIGGIIQTNSSISASSISGSSGQFTSLTSSVLFLNANGFPTIGLTSGERANIAASSSLYTTKAITAGGTGNGTSTPVSYTHLTLPTKA